MEYRVASSKDQEKLGKEVTDLLSDGCLLYGGIVVTTTMNYTLYTQALVKGLPDQVQNQIIGFAPRSRVI
jgi:Domain of unknown function (DUF1737)